MPKTILVVDDAATMRALVSMALRNMQYDVIEAVDGQDALEKLQSQQQKIALIVTDVNMPRMNGIELIKAAKALPQYKFVPIVMLTTESQAEKKEEGRSAGAKAWIVKPFKPDVLLDVVKKIIG
jgi:two-component system chemotaxis response regulator CheY